jgi:hypothetical protein
MVTPSCRRAMQALRLSTVPSTLGLGIARQSGWQRRVNQDDKGSRSLVIMLQLIVADKLPCPRLKFA